MVRLFCLFPLVCLLGLFPGAACADLVIVGSSTILPIIKRAAADFTAQTGIKLTLSGGGSGQGVEGVLGGRAHIGMVSRTLHADEAKQLVATPFAQDGVAIFVNERNSISALTAAQVADIYRGTLKSWRQLDATGPAGDIVRVGKWHGRSTRELFDSFFGLTGVEPPTDTKGVGSNVAGILYVSIDPQAIGYVSIGALDHAMKQGAPVKPLPLDGIAPSIGNVQDGQYRLTRLLNLVTRGEPQGEARRFIGWMRSEAGQRAAAAEGFIPVRVKP